MSVFTGSVHPPGRERALFFPGGAWYNAFIRSETAGGWPVRLLFTMDKKDYADCTRRFSRDSARSIVVRKGRIAMIHSPKYDYYKFPGGGIEKGEDPIAAMIRETREEAGLIVLPETVREYGYVHRIQRSGRDPAECFVQENYYYFCDVLDDTVPQKLDDYEAEESFRLVFVDPDAAIQANRGAKESPPDPLMLEREARVLELLLSEGVTGSF